MKRRTIRKVFKPGERVQLKFSCAPIKYHGKIAIVQDPPYTPHRSYGGYLNIKWEDDAVECRWRWPGSYFRRVIKKRRSQMPDTRSYLDIMSSLDI